MQQPRQADIRALVRTLQRGSAAEQAQAVGALVRLAQSGGRHAVLAALGTAGSIQALLQLAGGQRE